MLNLSIDEQREIIGGGYLCTIYNGYGSVVKRKYFDYRYQAESWGESQTRYNTNYYKIEYK